MKARLSRVIPGYGEIPSRRMDTELEFDLDDSLIFGVEGRYYYIKTADEVKDTFGRGHYHHILVMLKLGCRF